MSVASTSWANTRFGNAAPVVCYLLQLLAQRCLQRGARGCDLLQPPVQERLAAQQLRAPGALSQQVLLDLPVSGATVSHMSGASTRAKAAPLRRCASPHRCRHAYLIDNTSWIVHTSLVQRTSVGQTASRLGELRRRLRLGDDGRRHVQHPVLELHLRTARNTVCKAVSARPATQTHLTGRASLPDIG